MCTGPFKFTSYDGTSKLVLTKNEKYWDQDNAAHASTFTFVYPADPSALANGLTSGKIDGGLTLPSNLAAPLQNAANGKLYVGQEAPRRSTSTCSSPSPSTPRSRRRSRG